MIPVDPVIGHFSKQTVSCVNYVLVFLRICQIIVQKLTGLCFDEKTKVHNWPFVSPIKAACIFL